MTSSPLSLVIMAAGRARRYGGLKQLEGFGPRGQTIMDYTLHDAARAGVRRAVLVVAADHAAEFRDRVVNPWRGSLEVTLVSQELEDLPVLPVSGAGPAAREKPWGTGQALWAARCAVDGPFLVANADDFYGRQAIAAVADFLGSGPGDALFALQAYELRETLPGPGGFSRGFCQVDGRGRLTGIQEQLDVTLEGAPAGQLVSMNLWGFTPAVFGLLEDEFRHFLAASGHDPAREFYLPEAVRTGVASGRCQVQVLPPAGRWSGVTRPEDAPRVRQLLARLHAEGIYPEDLRP
jgi:NDP-sugar pyrophosphorylase family protein